MDKLRVHRGVAAALLRDNIDTDAIIPSREMKRVSKLGLSEGLFAGWRYTLPGEREPNPEFILNQPAYRDASILLAGRNFGCGSSREHAVWALHEFGIRVVIAPSFGSIFYSNCVRNGILLIEQPAEEIAVLVAATADDPQTNLLTVDLPAQRITTAGGKTLSFAIGDNEKRMLVEGLDGIALTLDHADAIDAFEAADRSRRPWIYL